MRVHLRLLVAVTGFLTVLSPALVEGRSIALAEPFHEPTADLQYVEQLLYTVALTEFVRIASAGDPWFDVTSDGCSAPLVGSTGRSFDFRAACRRHDFGYRNLKLLDRRYSCPGRVAGTVCPTAGRSGTYWNAGSRRRVDQQFLADMRGHCRARPWYEEATCRTWADVFYAAVRAAGGP